MIISLISQADTYAHIHISGEINISDGSAVDSTPASFQFINNLAGSDFRSSGQGPCRKYRGNNIQRGLAFLYFTAHCRAQMHDVGILMNIQISFHAYGSEPADLTQIISSQVDQHIMFCQLLLIVSKLLTKSGILFCRTAARPGASQWKRI